MFRKTIAFIILMCMLSFGFNRQTDSLALLDIYDSANGNSWKCTWDTSLSMDNWHGIRLTAGRVTHIDLQKNKLSGNLSNSIGNLDKLIYLDLHSNKLHNVIPSSLGNISALCNIILKDNKFSGSIPSNLGNISALCNLDIGNNELTGNIPNSFSKLSKLKYLKLNDNKLSGVIPNSIGNLDLYSLYLYNNKLSGTIPKTIGNMVNLKYLLLYNNELSGAIPNSISKLLKLKYLVLSYNKLSGMIPVNIGKLTALRNFKLDNNKLTCIPESIININRLRKCNFGSNKFCDVSDIVNGWLSVYDFDWKLTQNCSGFTKDTSFIMYIDYESWMDSTFDGMDCKYTIDRYNPDFKVAFFNPSNKKILKENGVSGKYITSGDSKNICGWNEIWSNDTATKTFDAITISAWFKPGKSNYNNHLKANTYHPYSSSTTEFDFMSLIDNDLYYKIKKNIPKYAIGIGAYKNFMLSKTELKPEWTHVTVTLDSDSLIWYINGVRDTFQIVTTHIIQDIRKWSNWMGMVIYLDGIESSSDDFAIRPKKLYSEEIKKLYGISKRITSISNNSIKDKNNIKLINNKLMITLTKKSRIKINVLNVKGQKLNSIENIYNSGIKFIGIDFKMPSSTYIYTVYKNDKLIKSFKKLHIN